MAAAPFETVVKHIAALTSAEMSDSDLLTRYLHEEDHSAFAAIIRRHGRVVLGVCRRLLGLGPDADDAFQATFVVLARKASSIRKQSSLASWLHGVAQRISSQSRSKRARQRQLEATVAGLSEAGHARETDKMRADPASRASMREMGVILDEELQRLPPACRDALVLCLMENVSHTDAAKRLGCPLGTLKGRIERGRNLLRQRLERRGIELTGIALSVLLAEQARAAVSASLLQATLHGAAHHATAPAVAALAEAVLATMTGKFKAMLAVIALAGVTLAGVGVGAYLPSQEPAPVVMKADPPAPSVQVKPDKKVEHVDAFGDLLPEGALARLGTVKWRHGSWVSLLAFAPDGKMIAYGGSEERNGGLDNLVRLCDVSTGKELHAFGKEPSEIPLCIAFTPDGAALAVETSKKRTIVWDTNTGRELQVFTSLKVPVQCVAISPDRKLLAAGAESRIQVWNLSTGKLWKEVLHDGGRVSALAFSPDGRTVACIWGEPRKDSEIKILETATWKVRYQSFAQIRSTSPKINFSADGKCIVVADDRNVQFLDVLTGKNLRSWELKALENAEEVLFAQDLIYSQNGEAFAVATAHAKGTSALWDAKKDTIALWDAKSGKSIKLFSGHGVVTHPTTTGKTRVAESVAVRLNPDGSPLVASGGADGTVRLWDSATGKQINLVSAHSGAVDRFAFCDQKQVLTISCAERMFRFWDAVSGKLLNSGVFADKAMLNVVPSPNGKLIAVSQPNEATDYSPDGTIRILDTSTGKVVRTLNDNWMSPLAFLPDGDSLLVREDKSSISFWSVSSGKLLRRTEMEQTIDPIGLSSWSGWAGAISPDGNLIASRNRQTGELMKMSGLVVMDAKTGKKVWAFDEQDHVAFAFSPDSKILAACVHRAIYLRSASDGAILKKLLCEVPGDSFRMFDWQANRMAFSPDGKTLIAGSGGRWVFVWDVVTGKELRRFMAHRGAVKSVTVSPDGKTFATTSDDNTAMIWEMPVR